MTELDLLIKNIRIVRPNHNVVDLLDVGIKNGRFAQIAPVIPAENAKEVFDGDNLLAFPGIVDAHTHVGIYQPLAEDAITESKAAAMGGVTTTSRSSQHLAGQILGRLRLSSRTNQQTTYRGNAYVAARFWCLVFQDIYVLWRSWTTRPFRPAA